MKENIIQQSITYFQTNAPAMLGKFWLWIVVFFIIYLIIKRIIRKVRQRMESNSLVANVYAQKNSNLVGNVLFVILMIFNVLATFEIIWFDVAIIMGGISMSLGFAMETTIGNMISGIFILTNKKIKLGDFVQFMGPLNMMGTIEEINIRYTVIRTFDKRRTIIPNSIIAKTPIKTLKTEPLLRGEIIFRVPRHVYIPQIKQIFIETINGYKNVMYPEYTSIVIDNFDTAGINIRWFFFINPAKKSPSLATREIKPKIFEALKKYGIKISYPHLTITVE